MKQTFIWVIWKAYRSIGAEQYEYWKDTQLIVDVAEGNCGIFSLENETGKCFLARPHLFSDEENTV